MRGTVGRKEVSLAMAQLMPQIMRGIQLDFFVKRGVTQTQFLVMAAVRAYSRCTMGTLAKNLHIRMPTASGLVERLVRAGYLRRIPQSDDRRQVVVTLTAKGEAFFKEFESVVRHRWEEVLVSLDEDELRAFHDVIEKLRQQLQMTGD